MADFIRLRQQRILAAWQEEVRQLPAARELPRPALIDHIPDVLLQVAELAAGIARGSVPELDSPEAGRHAVARLDASFDLAEVTWEYSLLRRCIARQWEQETTPPQANEGRAILDQAVDRALIASIEHYTQARDRTLQALDRVSTAALRAGSLDELLGKLLRVLLETTKAVDTAAILLREQDQLVTRAAVGLEEEAAAGFRLNVGEGFAGRIAAENEPRLLHSAASDPLLESPVIRSKGVKALYGVPIVDAGRVVGVVHMGSLTASDFSEQDKHLLAALASRASSAIAEHMARRGAQARARQQAAIAELSQRALAGSDIHALLEEAVAVVSQTLETELSKILELLPDGRALVLRAGVGWADGLVGGAAVGAGTDSQAGYTLMSSGPVVVEDLRTETRFSGPPLLHDHGVVSGMSVIIPAPGHKGRPYGVFGTHTRQRRIFTRDDVHFLRAIANVVAAAIANHESRRREQFLSEASRLLGESIEHERTLKTVAHLAVPEVADWCVVDLVGPGGSLMRVAIAHRDPFRSQTAEEFRQRKPARPNARRGPANVIRTRQSEFVPVIEDATIQSIAGDEEHLRFLRGLGLTSYVCVPLIARDRVIGAITLVTEGTRFLREQDLAMTEDLARRAATAIDNARLYADAQGAARAREELLGIVSHDLRNPLGAILMGAAGQIRVAPADEQGRAIRRYAQTIQGSAQRMSRLIDDLTDIGNLEAGRLAIERATEDPQSIVREIVDRFQTAAAERGLTVHYDECASAIPSISCDRARVVQALSNIVDNAVNVSPGGSVTMRIEAHRGEVMFAVSDTGPGIAPEDLPHLFERYWRSKAAPYKGTGLGLAIAKGIVEAHGGRIWAESRLGAGSTFFVALPA